MINNKKGLSTVVTTLIIILLVFIAVGIIWVVIRNVIQGGTENIDWNSKCLEVSVKSSNLNCADAADGTVDCAVKLDREAGGDDLTGIKVVLTNGLTNHVGDSPGNLAPLGTITPSINTSFLNGTTSITIDNIVPYFTDAQGAERLCQ